MDLELEGDSAVVAASSAGLGKATATALAAEGVDVVINGRTEERLRTAAADIRTEAAGDVHPVAGDIGDASDAERLIEAAVDEFGDLDHLVLNAGGPPRRHFVETDDEDWYGAFDRLVMSAVRLVRAARPHLERGERGTIVAITSTLVDEPASTNVLSSSVRTAVPGLLKCLADDLAPDVRTVTLLPGLHDTARRADAGPSPHAADDIPLKTVGDPEDFGRVAAFYCSPHASHVTGATLPVDGGARRSSP